MGAGVTVLAGVKIGDNGVFAGIPARKIADLANDCG
nr:hypothetical protein [Lactobacillus delbrueckii]